VPGLGLSLSSSCMAGCRKESPHCQAPWHWREIQDHGAHGRVLGRDFGKQPHHEGPDEAARIRSNPPASATFIRPRNKVMTPMRPRASSTELAADSIIALTGSPWARAHRRTHWISRQPAVTKATKAIPRNTTFISFQSPFPFVPPTRVRSAEGFHGCETKAQDEDRSPSSSGCSQPRPLLKAPRNGAE